MQQSLLPLLLLAITLAVSSTNELPFLNRFELEKIFEEQDNENNNDQRDDELILQLKRHPVLKPKVPNIVYSKENIGDENILKYWKNFNNNKKQKLEYPKYSKWLYAEDESNDNDIHKNKDFTGNSESDTKTVLSNPIGNPKKFEEIVTISPLLILKIRLSLLSNNIDNMELDRYTDSMPVDVRIVRDQTNTESVKRVGLLDDLRQDESDKSGASEPNKTKKVVKKRIFSLWSRLQGLTHRGHELHHRRHLHAFYGLPDDGGGGDGGTLTAETRATFMRPPGSPLRWG
ncbi:unnamed protein product [Leptosia nina]|uniref:Uncharacterized protein n=1 Tax=Leptosia nina TaxID=320188 RepID=A0AAV1JII0_9NEOP